MVFINYDGIGFDDYHVDDDDGHIWSQVCEKHAKCMQIDQPMISHVACKDLICGVAGCEEIAEYYIDFPVIWCGECGAEINFEEWAENGKPACGYITCQKPLCPSCDNKMHERMDNGELPICSECAEENKKDRIIGDECDTCQKIDDCNTTEKGVGSLYHGDADGRCRNYLCSNVPRKEG